MRSAVIYSLCITIALAFFSCKKYPENTLWFKSPEKVFKGGHITVYTIDGVDKMPDIRSWYAYFPYNYYKQTDDIFQLPFTYSSDGSLNCDYGGGTMKFSLSTKNVTLSFLPTNSSYGAQSLFMGTNDWTVEKLTKSGQLKLQARINEKTYVIQFN